MIDTEREVVGVDRSGGDYDEAYGPSNPHWHGGWRLIGEGPEEPAVLGLLFRIDLAEGRLFS